MAEASLPEACRVHMPVLDHCSLLDEGEGLGKKMKGAT